jgi:hypothetical protein
MEVEAMEGETDDEAGEEVVMEDMDFAELKQSSDKDQNINKSRNHNQAKKRIEQGSIRQVESEAQNLGNEGINNEKEDLGEGFKSNRNGIFNDPRFKPLLSNGCLHCGYNVYTGVGW